ncbi:esterase [Streptomyces sp. A012304]|nr:esterase [Streptomyces sp. A012304]
MTLGSMARHIEELLASGVERRLFPGAVWAVGDAREVTSQGACGVLDPCGDAEFARPMTVDTVFDLASITKILAAWSCVGVLVEDRRIGLDDPLTAYWPELGGHPLGEATVRHLLTHTAGLPLRANLRPLYGPERAAIERGVLHEGLRHPPGDAVQYTDRAALILGFLVERVTGAPLDRYCREQVWEPLGMRDTRFGPHPAAYAARCAPTEWDEETGSRVRGSVHDFSARALGGACGAAGVFSTAADLGRFLRYVLDPTGAAPAGPAFGGEWVRASLRVHTDGLEPHWGLLWFPPLNVTPAEDLWVHYGFTGTAMWVSPKRGQWAVLLTNKIYYSRDREPLMEVRDRFQEIVFGC